MAVSGLLLAGWTLPIMTVHKLVFFAEEVSIFAGARQLWDNGNYMLCAVVLTFSVAFPAAREPTVQLRHLAEPARRGRPGEIVSLEKGTGIVVQCSEGKLLILRVKPEGKKEMG